MGAWGCGRIPSYRALSLARVGTFRRRPRVGAGRHVGNGDRRARPPPSPLDNDWPRGPQGHVGQGHRPGFVGRACRWHLDNGACLHGRGTNQEPRRRGHRWRCRLAERFRIRGYDPGAFPMPGMRTGYGASHSSLRRQEQATGRLALVRQRRSQLCVHCGRRGVCVGVSLRSLATAAYARPEERP